MRISDRGIAFIKSWERYRSRPYNDGYGYLTIGYGHLIDKDEEFDSITVPQAHDILMKDIESSEEDVDRLVTVPLNQNQHDAVVSFFFNVGAANILQGEHTLPDLNRGEYRKFADHLLSWRKSAGKVSRGLIRRRTAERELFLS